VFTRREACPEEHPVLKWPQFRLPSSVVRNDRKRGVRVRGGVRGKLEMPMAVEQGTPSF